MVRTQAQLASGRAVGAELVGHDLVWSVALLLEQLAHEPQGRLCVALGLDQQVQHLTFAVDGSPQVHTPALDSGGMATGYDAAQNTARPPNVTNPGAAIPVCKEACTASVSWRKNRTPRGSARSVQSKVKENGPCRPGLSARRPHQTACGASPQLGLSRNPRTCRAQGSEPEA